jgi:hypothetical protein
MFVRGQPGNLPGQKYRLLKIAFNMETVKRKPNWSEKKKLMLVKEVNDREGRLFRKFAGVVAKGTQLKETAWEEVASMINRFVFAHPNTYRNYAFKRERINRMFPF